MNLNCDLQVPPHLRNAPSSSPAPGGGPPMRRKGPKHAPDISSEVYFPSLSAAMGTDDPNQGQDKSPQRYAFGVIIETFVYFFQKIFN